MTGHESTSSATVGSSSSLQYGFQNDQYPSSRHARTWPSGRCTMVPMGSANSCRRSTFSIPQFYGATAQVAVSSGWYGCAICNGRTVPKVVRKWLHEGVPMAGMMRSRVSGRGVWCDCCSTWSIDRTAEKRAWRREVAEELNPDFDGEYRFFRAKADAGLPILGGANLQL